MVGYVIIANPEILLVKGFWTDSIRMIYYTGLLYFSMGRM